MKANIPKIKFFYSPIYDLLLTHYEGKHFDELQEKEVKKYIQKLRMRWKKVSKPILRFLLKILKKEFKGKEIICYIVKNFRFSGISQPLTIKMVPNPEEAIINLIHELIHNFLSLEEWKKISQKLTRKFPKEKPEIILHLYINFIQLQVLRKFFKESTIEKMLRKYKKLKRIGKAWKIVLREEDTLFKLLKFDCQINNYLLK